MSRSARSTPIKSYFISIAIVAGCAILLASRGLAVASDANSPASPTDANKPGQIETVSLPGNVPLELAWIPAGSFMMGQNADEQDAYRNKETPRHRVNISRDFWMGRTEVTKQQWRAVMGTTPWAGRERAGDGDRTPAVFISWDHARSFVEKLTTLTGRPFRLPTEAEWEYACRAGTTTRFYWGDDPNYDEINQAAWWRGNAFMTPERHARPVGLLPPNPWGLCDMSGNVSEWCHDWHWFYGDGPDTDPVGPAFAPHRVLRGGSWLTSPGQCRSSRRHHEVPSARQSDIGFRIVGGEAPQPERGAPEISEVFVAGAGGVHTYRIPSLLLAPDGSLLAFCEARKEAIDDASPTDMVLRRSTDGGRTWLPTQVLFRGLGKEALMNPCPVVDHKNRTILLLCQKANQPSAGHNQHFQLVSSDNGHTWSSPQNLAARIANYDDSFNPGPGIGIQMRSGRLIVPGYTVVLNDEMDEESFARVLYSDDSGKHWTLGPRVPQLSDESQAVELSDGRLMLNARGNMGLSCRAVATSGDGGESWPDFRWDRALNECPCQASIFRYSLGRDGEKSRLLFSNPDNRGEKFNVVDRTHLTVRLSYDEGQTWPVYRLIHAGPASYSCLVRLPDGDIGLVFEGGEKHRREWIRFARFSIAWLTRGADQ